MLFDRLRGPLADPAATGSWWRGLRLVAWDGTSLQVADSTANLAHFGGHNTCHGPGGFPSLQLSALVECGTRALLDAVFGPAHTPENPQNQQLCRSLAPGMLLLADRASAGYPLMRRAVTAGAELLWRLKDNRVLPAVHVLPDGSFLSMVCDVCDRDRLNYWMKHPRPLPPQVTGVAVRVIEADITVTGPDGQTRVTSIRLMTMGEHHDAALVPVSRRIPSSQRRGRRRGRRPTSTRSWPVIPARPGRTRSSTGSSRSVSVTLRAPGPDCCPRPVRTPRAASLGRIRG